MVGFEDSLFILIKLLRTVVDNNIIEMVVLILVRKEGRKELVYSI